ncbi:Ldh family oxidoreductase, partial [Bradyrhizobium sp. NBAIM08]|uniref:Ldh family oxidoreductase n=1 Tax=Bradyrhizobium sp. NBAIM08 TaxID=2793815 RepID=UPI001CD3AA71
FLAFGGYKGSGLALITEVLGGLLSGNGLGKQYWDNRGHGVNGLFLQAVAVEEFQDLETFYDHVDELIAFIKSTKSAPGFSEILLPGESGRKHEAHNRQHGVEVEAGTWANLTALAAELGIAEVPAPL